MTKRATRARRAEPLIGPRTRQIRNASGARAGRDAGNTVEAIQRTFAEHGVAIDDDRGALALRVTSNRSPIPSVGAHGNATPTRELA